MNNDFLNKILHGDCFEWMPQIENKSIDMILCDLPYGTTQNKWDSILPLDLLWSEYERIIKDNGVVVLFAQTPFDKVLGASNIKLLKYEWIWKKDRGTGHLNAKKMPMKAHENILVFYKRTPTYNPQKTTGHKPLNNFYTSHSGSNYGKAQKGVSGGGNTDRYPVSIIQFNTVNNYKSGRVHPTQKPVDLLEYLIKTYTKDGDIVLDNCIGSGSTAVACLNTSRNFIGIEKEWTYCEIANERVNDALNKLF
jgi:DNA modification methylase